MYRLIYADPPWAYNDLGQSGSKKNSGSASHYSVMTVDDICALDVPGVCAPDALLFLWTTGPHIPSALRVLDRWDFEFKTVGFTWVKTGRVDASERALSKAICLTRDQRRALKEHPHLLTPAYPIGQGSYTRANPEYVLIGKRGRGVERVNKGVRCEVFAPRGAHSRKPDIVATKIEQLVGDVPRLEMFARRSRPGWDVWGNEVDSTTSMRGT